MSWFRSCRGRARRPSPNRSTSAFRPRLESLEDRLQPAFTGLGMAGEFAVLGLGNTQVHNQHGAIHGNAGVSQRGRINNSTPSVITQDVYQHSAGQYSGNGQIGGSLMVDPSTIQQANQDAYLAYSEAAAMPATMSLGSIAVPTTIAGNGGVNVVKIVGDIESSLTLQGGADEVFVVNVTGKLKLQGNSILGLSGGVTPNHVLYNFIGHGGTLATEPGNVVYGSILATSRTIHFDGTFFGLVIGGGGTMKFANTQINAVEFELPAPAQVISTQVNDGGFQRSRVTDLTVTFDRTVTFATTAENAFMLLRNSDGAPVSFTATVNTINGDTIVTLSNFGGLASQFGSLADGRYTLTALSDQISAGGEALDGDGDGVAGGNFTFGDAQGLFRMFGDVNGDRQVDGFDFGAFTTTYGLLVGHTGYLWYLDVNGDGQIDGFDFGQFGARYGTLLP
jgi:hypothetical protein